MADEHETTQAASPDGSALRRAAVVQVVLEGVPLPAVKRELIAYARKQDPPAEVLSALASIPDREYALLDEVGDVIASIRPKRTPEVAPEPRPESGEVPGGAAYLDPAPEPGRIGGEPTILPYEQQLVREPAPVAEGVPEKGSEHEKPGPSASATSAKTPRSARAKSPAA